MSYHLKSGESVAEGIRRIAAEEIGQAATLLSEASAEGRDEAIHEARKNLKKTRALLRLVSPGLRGIYGEENRRFRDAGRKLSEFRDGKAMIEIFDHLREHLREELGKTTLAPVRRGLIERKKEREKQASIESSLKRIAGTLRASGRRIEQWPLKGDGFAVISAGLTETYREGRRALAQAGKHSRPEYAHEWRKRVKDHWYHVRLLENLWTDLLKGYEASLKDLETWLGDHHNLVVLGEAVQVEPERFGGDKVVKKCLGLIAKFEDELRRNALSLGERVYEERPKEFTRRMKHLWDSWQAEPKSLKKAEKAKAAAAPS